MALSTPAARYWIWPLLVGAVYASPACAGRSRGDAEDSSHPSTGGSGGRGGSASSGAVGHSGGSDRGGNAGAGTSGATGGSAALGGDAGSGGEGGSDDAWIPMGEDSLELGDEGGELAVGFATLIVPPGALAAPIRITLRRLASGTSVLDDVYEMLPAGLEFLEPARFVLRVGPERAESGGESRVLTYVDGPVPVVLSSSVNLPTEGTYAAAVRHFSQVAAVRRGVATASQAFGGFDFALPYAVSGGCGGLESEFSKDCRRATRTVRARRPRRPSTARRARSSGNGRLP